MTKPRRKQRRKPKRERESGKLHTIKRKILRSHRERAEPDQHPFEGTLEPPR